MLGIWPPKNSENSENSKNSVFIEYLGVTTPRQV